MKKRNRNFSRQLKNLRKNLMFSGNRLIKSYQSPSNGHLQSQVNLQRTVEIIVHPEIQIQRDTTRVRMATDKLPHIKVL